MVSGGTLLYQWVPYCISGYPIVSVGINRDKIGLGGAH